MAISEEKFEYASFLKVKFQEMLERYVNEDGWDAEIDESRGVIKDENDHIKPGSRTYMGISFTKTGD